MVISPVSWGVEENADCSCLVASSNLRSGVGTEDDWSNDWQQPQKEHEGRCWADMNATTADNIYTGEGGTKRD